MNQQKQHQNIQKENVEITSDQNIKKDESKQRLASIMEKIRLKKIQLEQEQKQNDKLMEKVNFNKDIEQTLEQSSKKIDNDKKLENNQFQKQSQLQKSQSIESKKQNNEQISLHNSNNSDESDEANYKIQQTQESNSQNSNTKKSKSDTDYQKNVLSIEELNLNDMRQFVSNPPPKGKIIQVSILRDRSGIKNRFYPKYHIFFSENINCHIMSVKKKNTSKSANYTLSLSRDDFSKKSNSFLAKLRSNFIGTEFFLYDNGVSPKKQTSYNAIRKELAYIKYEKNIFGVKGPRKLRVITPQYIDNKYQEFRPLGKQSALVTSSKHFNSKINCFMNNPPQWNEEYEAFVLDFYNRVDKASVKNFQLIEVGDTNHNVLLQFGKIGDHIFNLDFSYPFSMMQAVAIAISSCDNKLFCEQFSYNFNLQNIQI